MLVCDVLICFYFGDFAAVFFKFFSQIVTMLISRSPDSVLSCPRTQVYYIVVVSFGTKDLKDNLTYFLILHQLCVGGGALFSSWLRSLLILTNQLSLIQTQQECKLHHFLYYSVFSYPEIIKPMADVT